MGRRKKENVFLLKGSEILLDIFMPEDYIDYLRLNENREIMQYHISCVYKDMPIEKLSMKKFFCKQ